MSRPKPTVILQHSDKSTYKVDEVLSAEAVWAVFYDGKPINLKLQIILDLNTRKFHFQILDMQEIWLKN